MEMVECGAAALGIVLGYHGLFVPLEELRVTCGVSRDGSKASNVVKAARKYGMVAKGYRRTPESAREMTFPAIVHWNFNHFLVVEGFHKDIVYLNDPASGPRTVSAEEFDEAFTGVILTFEKGEEFQKGGRKNNVLPSLIKRLRGSSEALVFVVLASLALVIPGLLIPTFSRIFVDSYLVDGRTEWILPLIIGMGVTAIMRSILTWLQQRYLLRLETKLALTTSGQLVWHILRLPMEFFTQRSAGDISSRIRSNDRVAKLLSGELATTALNSILIVFYATLMWLYSPLLTVIGATIAGFNGIVLRYVSRKRVDINQKMIQDQAKLIGTSFSGLQSIETIKATGREDDFFARWAGYQTKLVNAKQELGVFTQIVMVVPTFLASLATALVLIVGGYNVIAGTMTIGMLVAFQSLMTSFLTPVTQIVMMSTQVQEIEGIMNRLDDVHKYKPDPQADVIPTAPSATQTHKLSGTVQLRNLSFGYNRLAKPLIEDFNLDLQPGMRVAFVGPSGSGKSTLARLISGLYTPWGGDILFDQ
ncbi:MAG TPA: ATP-binding cassette domain-containing protein, partial [Anaerolineae bacterium]|nr:ATP-binding cassette domain-containing protein [Anaerolineae bacterium]